MDRLLAARVALPHALLIHGPEGIGKTAFGEALARSLLCESPGPAGRACGRCQACHWLEVGSHPDYRLLVPAATAAEEAGEGGEPPAPAGGKKPSTQIVVEQIRALSDFINVTSHRGGAKVMLIHPAESVNIAASNAVLKSLEEPPPNTYFVLVSHRPNRLLATVKSRCRKIALARPEPDAALAWMNAEGIADAAVKLAQCGGAPLLAADRDDAEYWNGRRQFMARIAEPGFDPLSAAESFKDVPVAHLVEWLQKWSYDIALHGRRGAVRYNPDQGAAVAALARRLDGLAVLRFHRGMVRLQRSVAHPLNARLFIEQLLIDYAALAGARRAA